MSDLSTATCTELQARVTELEGHLGRSNDQLRSITSEMSRDGWYSDSIDKSDILEQLCQILDVSPKITVSITAQVEVYITADIDIADFDSFDADDYVTDVLSMNVYNGDANLDDWSVSSVDYEEQ